MERLRGAVMAADGELKRLAGSKEAAARAQAGARAELEEMLGGGGGRGGARA